MAGNFQHMTGGGGNPMMMQAQQHQQQQQAQGMPTLQQILASQIQQQQPHRSGWQSNVNVGERFNQVWQIVTQLRLANNNQPDLQKICQIALTFERNTLDTAPDKETYSKTLRDRLEHLTTVRSRTGPNAHAQLHSQSQAHLQAQNQANKAQAQAQAQAHAQAQQMNMANQIGGQGQLQRGVIGQQQAQQPFHHLQHQMQASPLPGQQQLQQQQQPQLPQQRPQQGLSMGIGGNALPPNISAQQLHQQQHQQPFQMAMQPQQMPSDNRQQPGPGGFTPQEQNLLNQATQRMLQIASEEEKNAVRQNMRSRIDPATLMRYQNSNVDLAMVYYRSQALLRYRQTRQGQNQLQQSQGMQPNINTPSAAPMQPQRSGNAGVGNGQGQQGLQMPTNQDFGSFLGGSENLMGQQQQPDGVGQDMGQMGISTNTQQGNSTTHGLQGLGGPQSGPNGQRPLSNPNLRAQQANQAFNNQQSQADRMNHTAQSQAQFRANAAAQAKAAQQMSLHGQPGGMGPMPPQQSPAMTTLNAPLRTPQQPQQPNPVDTLQMNQPTTAHFGQPLDPRFVQANQQRNVQGGVMTLNGQMAFQNLTQDQRQKLSQLPKEKLNEVIGKWSGKPQSAMPVNVPGVRPNQSNLQASSFTQQAMANQFMNNGQNAEQQAQMMGNMTPQNMMLRQQQVTARLAQQQGRPPNMPPGMMQMDQAAMIRFDLVDLPPTIRAAHPLLRTVPPEIKRWGELKQWASHNQMAQQDGLLDVVKTYQKMHFTQLIRSRTAAQQSMQAAGPTSGPAIGQSGPAPIVPPGMAPVAPMSINQLQMPNGDINNLGGRTITQEEIQTVRAHQNGKWANLNDEQIKQMIAGNKYLAQSRQLEQSRQLQIAQKAQQAQAQSQQQGNQIAVQRTPQPQPQRPQNPNQTPKQTGRGQSGQSNTPQGTSQQQPTAPDQVVPAATVTRPTKGGQAARPNQAAPSLQQPLKNNLKRASSDEIVEVPNPKFQQPPRSAPQPPIGQPKPAPQSRAHPTVTPQTLASLTPEQRQQYQQTLARQPSNILRGNPADIQKCNQVFQEEVSRMEPLQPIPMTPDQRLATASKLANAGSKLKRVKQALPKWFAITHDENRLRLFCRTYQKISQQFQGGDMDKLRDTFSVKPADVVQAYVLANNMMADVTKQFPNLSKSANGAAVTGVAAPAAVPANETPPTQAVPLNAVNLQQQQQALKLVNQTKAHNRSNSRNAPPAAPTSAHAPSFPADALPTQLTQDQLRLPRNKKQKHSATSTPLMGQNTPGSTTSQPIKSGSPDAKTQQVINPKETERVGFYCPEVYCEHHFMDGFENEDALEKHKEEEHVKPIRNPPQFALGELTKLLKLETEGTSKNASDVVSQTGAVLESSAMSKYNNTPVVGGTPMDRQLSTNVAKASPANPKDLSNNKTGDVKDSNFQSKSKVAESAGEGATAGENPWAAAAVNPQDLMHNFLGLETGAGGAIFDMSVYRSITPNDTPESSKDGISEPTSDISEGLDLSINLDFFDNDFKPFGPGDADDLLGLSKISVNPDEDMGGIFDDENSQYVPWNDFMDQSMFDKPFAFDTSMFSMNAE